jgi:hypothetical protein
MVVARVRLARASFFFIAGCVAFLPDFLADISGVRPGLDLVSAIISSSSFSLPH